MAFSSHIFLFLFLPVAWISFRLTARFWGSRAACVCLIISSLFFYSWENPIHLVWLLFSASGNYALGRYLAKQQTRSVLPISLGVGLNLALLVYFKYTIFAVENLKYVFGLNLQVDRIALPLGISFFTFQQIAYLVDCRRGEAGKGDHPLDYLLKVVFFAKMPQGPIARAKEMLPQIADNRFGSCSWENIGEGVTTIILGLFKKVIIADALSPLVSQLFDGHASPTAIDAWIGTLAYTFQIYFDFSGYSDMAIGIGKLFGLKVPINFDSPYKSTSIVEFWRRWHISLSFFLRDYLYFSLGGNRKGTLRRYANLLITMLLGGLWHGAAWTFVAWGGFHGLVLCITHAWRGIVRNRNIVIPRWIAWFLTFQFLNVSWVLFRAPSFTKAIDIYRGMIGLNGLNIEWKQLFDFNLTISLSDASLGIQTAFIIILFAMVLFLPTAWRWAEQSQYAKKPLMAPGIAMLFILAILFMTRVQEFIYVQF